MIPPVVLSTYYTLHMSHLSHTSLLEYFPQLRFYNALVTLPLVIIAVISHYLPVPERRLRARTAATFPHIALFATSSYMTVHCFDGTTQFLAIDGTPFLKAPTLAFA